MATTDHSAAQALQKLPDVLQLDVKDADGPVEIAGGDFPQISPHRLATTNAVAMAAHAVDDAVALMSRDVMAKNHGEAAAGMVQAVCRSPGHRLMPSP